MDLKGLRRRCEARIRSLDLPVPFDAWTFCDVLAAGRRRPIRLCPVANLTNPCGLWVATPTADYIFYERDTSPLHQEHIILHEVSHLLCEHQSAQVGETDFVRQLFPDLRPELVQSVLRRATYSVDEEREAELLASLILEKAADIEGPAVPTPDPEIAGLLNRLETSLEEGAWGQP